MHSFAGEVREGAARTERRLFIDGGLESSRAPHDATPDVLPLLLCGVLFGENTGRSALLRHPSGVARSSFNS